MLPAPDQHRASLISCGSKEVGWEPLLVSPSWGSGWWAASPESLASLRLGPFGFDLVAFQSCSRLVWGELGLLRSYIMRAGLGLVLGSFRLGKGLISRMHLGGFEVDFESVWLFLELICASCAARFRSSCFSCQPASQPASQPTNQPTDQPTNQSSARG